MKAQQEPLFTQYMYSQMSFNPAYAGTRDALNATLFSRLQWVGLEGAPRSYSFSANMPIPNFDMGVGLSMVADNIGPIHNTYVTASYAYRVMLNSDLTLSFGLKAGGYYYYAGLNDLPINSLSDPSFVGNLERTFRPNAGFGVYMYHERYYAGFSIPKLFQSSLSDYSYDGEKMNEVKRHYYITGGYLIDIDRDFQFKPSFVERIVGGVSLSTDVTAMFSYLNTYWAGISYRFGDAVSFITNVQINPELTFGYSYDFTTSALSNTSNGSHEIFISYDYDGFGLSKSKHKSNYRHKSPNRRYHSFKRKKR
jgi:type IX secretion system PorP/SprF family membrane protein